jgi:hypothetical protein
MAEKQGPATYPEVLKLHQELRANFEAQFEKLKPKRKLSPDDLIVMRKADLDKTKAAIAEVEKQRDASTKAWDDRLARLKKRAEQQTADVGNAKDSAKEAAKGAKAATAASTAKAAAAPPAKKK